MPDCMKAINISKTIHATQQQKHNENDQIFGDSECEVYRDHQDHTAFGIEIDQHLSFQKG